MSTARSSSPRGSPAEAGGDHVARDHAQRVDAVIDVGAARLDDAVGVEHQCVARLEHPVGVLHRRVVGESQSGAPGTVDHPLAPPGAPAQRGWVPGAADAVRPVGQPDVDVHRGDEAVDAAAAQDVVVERGHHLLDRQGVDQGPERAGELDGVGHRGRSVPTGVDQHHLQRVVGHVGDEEVAAVLEAVGGDHRRLHVPARRQRRHLALVLKALAERGEEGLAALIGDQLRPSLQHHVSE